MESPIAAFVIADKASDYFEANSVISSHKIYYLNGGISTTVFS